MMICLVLTAVLFWPSTILVAQPPAHLRASDLPHNVEVDVRFALDVSAECLAAFEAFGLPRPKHRPQACHFSPPGAFIIVPAPGTVCPAHLSALIEHELGHVIAGWTDGETGETLDAGHVNHIGWLPRRVSCADPEPETIL